MKSDADVDRLYGLPLDEFIGERAALVKRLRAEKRRDEATAAAKLTKPSAAAWAANQVLRSQATDAKELFASGRAVERAQRDLVAGKGDRGALDEAGARHRKALERLGDAARGLLDTNGKGLSQTTLERVRETLNAVSLDPELRGEGEAARLVKERSYAGLGLGAMPSGTPVARPAKTPKDAKPAKKSKDAAKAKAAAKAQAKAEREAKAAAKRREREIAKAQAQVEKAERALKQAREELSRLQDAPG